MIPIYVYMTCAHLCDVGAPYVPPTEREFAAGDTVKVELDPEVWKMLQEGFGGWNDYMATVSMDQKTISLFVLG